ncbi:MAG: hypothetical protein KDA25_13145, partial [Phycisphaerales bacterium]|nr:hypothetical protein [Phycisphaerales bacterium]
MASLRSILTMSTLHGPAAIGAGLTMAALGVAAVVFSPQFLHASDAADALALDRASEAVARDADHQVVIDALAGVLERAAGVISINQRGPTPYVEVVLWLTDAANPGRVDRGEIAVLSHSEVLRMVTLYTLSTSVPVEEAEAPASSERHRVGTPAFCDDWRSSRDVEPRVIATHVPGMEIAWAAPPVDGPRALRIALTWSGNPVDGSDTATRIVRTPEWNDRTE